jgi:shikimate dehydrogenase
VSVLKSNPSLDRYAVVGNPIAHSQSPWIHAEFARETGQPLHYGRLLAPFDGFEAALRHWVADASLGAVRGCNVTVPFKFEAFRLASRHTPRAGLAQAANVLCFEPDGWLADNTDGVGLVNDIERNSGVCLAGKRLLLIGAGGAAAGAVGALLAARPAQLTLANRTVDKACALADRFASSAGATRLAAAPLDDCGAAFDVVVNASSSSLKGAQVPVAPAVLGRGALAVDMMYGAAAQPFVDWARAHGAEGRDGLGMLVEQAAEAFLLWRGVRPQTAPVLAALRERLATSAS